MWFASRQSRVLWLSNRPWVLLFGWRAVQANVDIPLSIVCVPLQEWGRSHMTDFGEDCNYLFGSASQSLEFHKWALTWEKPDWRLLHGFQVILVSSHLICTTDDFAISFLHSSLVSTALWDLANSRPVHSLMLSSHLFLCLPCLVYEYTKVSDLPPSIFWSMWRHHTPYPSTVPWSLMGTVLLYTQVMTKALI